MLLTKITVQCDECDYVETMFPVLLTEDWWPKDGMIANTALRHNQLTLPKGWQADDEGNLTCPTCLAVTADLPCLLEQQQRWEDRECVGERLQAFCPA